MSAPLPEQDRETRGARLIREATVEDLVAELFDRHAVAVIFVAHPDRGAAAYFSGPSWACVGGADRLLRVCRAKDDEGTRAGPFGGEDGS